MEQRNEIKVYCLKKRISFLSKLISNIPDNLKEWDLQVPYKGIVTGLKITKEGDSWIIYSEHQYWTGYSGNSGNFFILWMGSKKPIITIERAGSVDTYSIGTVSF